MEGVTDGGVNDPLVGVLPWLPSVEAASVASVEDFSVLKLAFDRRLIDLRDRKVGAMAVFGLHARTNRWRSLELVGRGKGGFDPCCFSIF